MAKYDPLTAYLRKQARGELPLRFSDVERILDAKLPRSAYRHRAWWANESNGHVHAKAWLDAGFETAQVDMEGRKLVFRRVAGPMRPSGLAEETRMFKHDDKPAAKFEQHPATGSMKGLITASGAGDQVRHHPLVGCLAEATTFTTDADIMAPIYTEEEWNEFTERKARLLEEGLKQK